MEISEQELQDLITSNEQIAAELSLLRQVCMEQESELEIIQTAKNQSDLGLDKYIEAMEWKEKALKDKDKEIARLNKIIADGKIDLSVLNEIRELYDAQIIELRKQINTLLNPTENAS